MYTVTKPRLPNLAQYLRYVEQAHDRAWLTNFGPLHEELTARLEEYLGVSNLLLVANGTLALQVAYRALGLSGTVLTTPFSFIATASSLRWEGLTPAFVDIDPSSFNLNPNNLEDDLQTASGIVAVHVFGNPCEVEPIERIAAKRRIPVIYDAAHAFGSTYDGQSVLRWGDAATLSFHATKVFHTVEGGAIVFRDEGAYREARALISFGQRPDGSVSAAGINCKLSEYHAAAGLALLDGMDDVIAHRAELVSRYQRALGDWVDLQVWHPRGQNNGAYMPVLLADEQEALGVASQLTSDGIQTRRYFYPSLDQLTNPADEGSCPVSQSVASRIICLPLYADLLAADVDAICERFKHGLELIRSE